MLKTLITTTLFGATLILPTHGWAANLTCPDLGQAQVVGTCPSEEELRHTFNGYCADDNKAYRGETDVCTDFQRYKALKDVVLWESSDGRFDAYVSCAQSAVDVRKATAQKMQIVTQGKINRLVCSYSNGQHWSHRTRAQCSVEVASCNGSDSACRARCED